MQVPKNFKSKFVVMALALACLLEGTGLFFKFEPLKKLLAIETIPSLSTMLLFISSFIMWHLVAQSEESAKQSVEIQASNTRLAELEDKSECLLDQMKSLVETLKMEDILAIGLFSMMRHGKITFPGERFFVVWTELMRLSKKSFKASSYMHPIDWENRSHSATLAILKSQMLSKGISAKRLFIYDDDAELEQLGPIIIQHQIEEVSVRHICSKDVARKCPSLDTMSYIVVDDYLVLFHLDSNRKIQTFDVILDNNTKDKYLDAYNLLWQNADTPPAAMLCSMPPSMAPLTYAEATAAPAKQVVNIA